MINTVAIYCRLSREDGEIGESNSISNQRDMLKEYAKSNNFSVFKVYVDDGYSGTTFERPGFQQMLHDADKHLFNVVLVKDLSRFGRNYLKTGHYIEEYFPERNIRVIAVNDNFDSDKPDNDFAPFKNIINEWYTKDISKKVKYSHKIHQEQGIIPTGKLPLFGYMYDKDRNRILDPNTAHIVREIFDLYVKGKSHFEICSYLTKKKYLIPGYYYYCKYGYNSEKFSSYSEEKQVTWTNTMVSRILSSREYTGDLYLAKSYVKSYKNHRDVFNKLTDQIKFEKKFPPIISDEVYAIACKLRDRYKRDRKEELFESKFNGLFRCKNCGKPLNAKHVVNKNSVLRGFVCRNPKCKCHTFIKTDEALAILDQELEFLTKVLANKEEFVNYCASYIKRTIEVETGDNHSYEIDNLINRNKKLEEYIGKLFEEHLEGFIPEEAYKKLLSKYKKELESNEDLIKDFEAKKPKKVDVNYGELATSFIYSLSTLNGNRDLGKLLQIFNGIYIHKRKGEDGIVDFDYGKLGLLLKEFMHEKFKR